ncbi:nucleoside diphosphate-linked moiety X motif 6 [Neodiprion fabricii]|uniref:nucleoside diphosphate-linked moiety X motif 6 n=1 Tax=Neodiprion fabricii TaxID=2872261 RepID=UPI001ED8F69D|nr:nucleoside diphosphate-linked moiety X motif 6 [Neodiprion fabricii]XP_046424393.1 nucleoside diphosphate-linked moiety X motif 6 [Neodiprion fabricii]
MYSVAVGLAKILRIPQRSTLSGVTDYVSRSNMARSTATSSIFKGSKDRFNGITVDSTLEPCDSGAFSKCLKASLDQWIRENRRAIWFRVGLEQSDWIPDLTKNGFKFHHARDDWVTLYRWLPTDQTCNIPPYAHTLLGVGAIVYNEDTDEILVVKEKYSVVTPMWKFPGGYVEPGEDITVAAEREVMEETGIEAEFKHILSFRHAHRFAYGCSDIYMVACLTPRSYEITKCNREITDCVWMKLDEYVQHPEVHENNRLVAEKFIEFKNHKRTITVQTLIHPAIKTPFRVFTISKLED